MYIKLICADICFIGRYIDTYEFLLISIVVLEHIVTNTCENHLTIKINEIHSIKKEFYQGLYHIRSKNEDLKSQEANT